MLDLSAVPTVGNLLGQTQVWIAFEFYSDDINAVAEGAYVDNVVLRKCEATSCATAAFVNSIDSLPLKVRTERTDRTP